MKAVEAKGSFAALLVGLCVMGAFGDDLVVDTTAGDRTIAENIALAEGEVLRKVGPNTLTLTGHNTFGGLVQLEGGTLRADFGQGLDANYGVSFMGGALSSLTGSIVATCGTGAGQFNFLNSADPAFTAIGVPLTVDLSGGKGTSTDGSLMWNTAFPSQRLVLNTAAADQPLTWLTPIDTKNTKSASPFRIKVEQGVAILRGSIMNSTYNSDATFIKEGAGTLVLAGEVNRDRVYRFNIDAGHVNMAHPEAISTSANGSGYFTYFNVRNGSSFVATNQAITVVENTNLQLGDMVLVGGTYNQSKCDVNVCSVVTNDVCGLSTLDVDGTKMTINRNFNVANLANGNGFARLHGGAEVTASAGLNIGCGRCVVEDAKLTLGGISAIGSVAGAEGVLDLFGELAQTSSIYRFGTATGARGECHIENTTIDAKTTLPMTYSLGYATGGFGRMTITNAVVETTGFFNVGCSGEGELEIGPGGRLAVLSASQFFQMPANETGIGRAFLKTGGCLAVRCMKSSAVEASHGLAELTFDGGTLAALADAADFIAPNVAVRMTAAGGAFDTAGYDVTVSNVFAQAADAGTALSPFTKVGAGTLRFVAAPTFANALAVSEGLLAFEPAGTTTLTSPFLFNGGTLRLRVNEQVLDAAAGVTVAQPSAILLDIADGTPSGTYPLIENFGADTPIDALTARLVREVGTAHFVKDGATLCVALEIDTSFPRTARWSGGAGTGDITQAANWSCLNFFGEPVEAVPMNLTSVILEGDVDMQVPSGTTLTYADIAIGDVRLTADCDWRGLGTISVSGTIDLAGHMLTVTGVTGGGEVTDFTLGAAYELLESVTANEANQNYVNTGLVGRNNLRVEADFSCAGPTGGGCILGARNDNTARLNPLWYGGSNGTWGIGWNNMYYGAQNLFAAGTRYQVTSVLASGQQVVTANGQEVYSSSYSGNVNSGQTLWVFGCNSGKSVYKNYVTATLYSMKIWQDETLVRDFVPARRTMDGAIGLLDRLTNEFYTSSGKAALVAGPVVSQPATAGTLCVDVAEGETFSNGMTSFTGTMKLVKIGAGTWLAARGQTYTGGTEVRAGTFLLGGNGDVVCGAGGEFRVNAGAVLDLDGWGNHTPLRFVLDGGTIRSLTDRGLGGSASMVSVTLLADSAFEGRDLGFAGASGAPATLNLGDHTLTFDVMPGKFMRASNLTVNGTGRLLVRGGMLQFGLSNRTMACTAKDATLEVESSGSLRTYATLTVANYISRSTSETDENFNNTKIVVTGRFVPNTKWHAGELASGAVLDLSELAGVWTPQCSFATSKTSAVMSLGSNAGYAVDVGTRKLSDNLQLIAWEEPPGAEFTLVGTKSYYLQSRPKGLFCINNGSLILLR